MRYHLEHPTQHAACGTNTYATVLTPEQLATKPAFLHCKRCLKVHAALAAGRKALSGYDNGAGSVGGRTVASLNEDENPLGHQEATTQPATPPESPDSSPTGAGSGEA